MSIKRKNKILLGLSGASLLFAPYAAQAMSPNEAISAVTEKLHLADVSLDYRDSYGQNIHATLPDGTRVEVHLDRDGEISKMSGNRKKGFTEQSVRTLIPTEIQQNASYPKGAYFQKLDLKDGFKIEIEGYSADSRAFKAEFRHDGKLLDLKKE
ncbi:hypothetical protein [uncultured Cohaesibacter sp.]|uniref:hypothetical protein n=1 Tax=uncultured Cohaesibacter sp. TaxID=1002546 RepID=UPI0029C72400|nr:hypothetical protein [uncultured Cohaesibacter sp.]